MAIYQIESNDITPIQETNFASQGLKERDDLQRLLKNKIEVISKHTLIVAEEFGGWDESRRRIDLLGIDTNANIVVIELKRTEDGGHMELQAIRYAAMVSTLTFEKVVDIYEKYLKENNCDDNPREMLLAFLGWDEPDEEQFAQDVRIVLASSNFSKELTTAVMWLNQRDLDIRCVRMKPYKDGDRTLLDVQTVIPLPEVEEYQIQIKEKQQKEREARKSTRDFTKYMVTINGETINNLPKRGVMFNVIKPIIESGVHPSQIAEVISWRKNNLFVVFDEILDADSVYEKLMETDVGGKVPKNKRYFSKEDEIFIVEDKTYVLSNQWGNRTIEAVDALIKAFSNISIEMQPQD